MLVRDSRKEALCAAAPSPSAPSALCRDVAADSLSTPRGLAAALLVPFPLALANSAINILASRTRADSYKMHACTFADFSPRACDFLIPERDAF
jgi:hypothetical protein